MFIFSKASRTRLETCDERLQRLFNEVIRHYDCTIVCGYRSEEAQNEAFRTGMSKLQFPNSKHNRHPSIAVDVAPYINGGIPWKDLTQFYHFGGFVLGVASQMNIPIRWGGDWNSNNNLKDQTFFDLPHFELVG